MRKNISFSRKIEKIRDHIPRTSNTFQSTGSAIFRSFRCVREAPMVKNFRRAERFVRLPPAKWNRGFTIGFIDESGPHEYPAVYRLLAECVIRACGTYATQQSILWDADRVLNVPPRIRQISLFLKGLFFLYFLCSFFEETYM